MRSCTANLLALTTLALTSTAIAQEKKIDRSALPAAVEKTVQAQCQGATIKGFATDREHGRKVYEAEMTINGHSRDIEIAEDGHLNEVEEEATFDSLPPKVQSSLKAKSVGAKITKIESITKNDKLVAYEAAILKGTKKSEIQVGPDGEKLSHEQ